MLLLLSPRSQWVRWLAVQLPLAWPPRLQQLRPLLLRLRGCSVPHLDLDGLACRRRCRVPAVVVDAGVGAALAA